LRQELNFPSEAEQIPAVTKTPLYFDVSILRDYFNTSDDSEEEDRDKEGTEEVGKEGLRNRKKNRMRVNE
jgi:hypothetical protein